MPVRTVRHSARLPAIVAMAVGLAGCGATDKDEPLPASDASRSALERCLAPAAGGFVITPVIDGGEIVAAFRRSHDPTDGAGAVYSARDAGGAAQLAATLPTHGLTVAVVEGHYVAAVSVRPPTSRERETLRACIRSHAS